MWWECSVCGHQVERPKRPLTCDECGIAGDIFVEADIYGEGVSDQRSLREIWLRAGLEGAAPLAWAA